MSHYEAAQKLVQALGKNVGLPDLTLDDNKLCSICLDDKMVVNLQYHEEADSLIMHACVGLLTPATDTKEFFQKLLVANCFWRETAGGTLGVDPESKLILLSYAVPMPLPDPEQFQPMLMQFVDVVEHWIQCIGNLSPAEKKTS